MYTCTYNVTWNQRLHVVGCSLLSFWWALVLGLFPLEWLISQLDYKERRLGNEATLYMCDRFETRPDSDFQTVVNEYMHR